MTTHKELVERIWNQSEHHRGKRIALWCKSGHTRKERAQRWEAFHRFAHQHAIAAKDRREAARYRLFYGLARWSGKVARAIRRRIRRARKPDDGWPVDMHIVELFNNDNGMHNHVHIASTDRDALVKLGNIAVAHYGGAGGVREFPPFDPVECVHVATSWHYRDSSSPYTPRTCANRGDGCAMDCGFANRQAFGDEVKRRYGADACDF